MDSGAWKSSFPLEIAADLGIGDDELIEDLHGGIGVGSHFRVWNTTASIRAGIGLFELDANGDEQGWGPGFPLSPAFTEHDAFLLGRADFFRSFTVTFETGDAGQVFHIDTLS